MKLARAVFGKVVLATLPLIAAPALAQTEPIDVGFWNLGPFGGDPPAGFCFDLMEAIADRSGLAFTYHPMPAADLIPGVIADTLDVECSALTPIGRRDPGIVFIGPILTNYEAIIVAATDGTAYATLADFAGMRIGTTPNPGRQAHITNAGYEPVILESPAAAGAALAAGEIDAWMVNAAEAPRLSTETAGLRIADTYQPTMVSYGMIGVGDGQVELMGQIAQALEGLKIDGTIDIIADRHAVPRPAF